MRGVQWSAPAFLAGLLLLASLTACGDASGPASVSGPTVSPEATVAASPASTDEEVVLAAAGDIMLGRSIGEGVLRRGSAYPFEFVAQALREADIAFANLESPISGGGLPAEKDFVFRAPPEAAEGLAAAGIDVVSLANNHALDYGLEGLSDTLAALTRWGVRYAGAGQDIVAARRPVVLEAKGLRLAILAYVSTPNDGWSGFDVSATAATTDTAGVAWATVEAVSEDVAKAAAQADIVVVSLHTGLEYREAPSQLQRELARAAIDAGADLVLGHHPHVLQGIEEYRGGLIVYSLGNFVFDFDDLDYAQPGLPSALSLILRVRLGPDGVRGYDYLPIIIGEEDGRPRLASGEAASAVEERIKRLSAALRED